LHDFLVGEYPLGGRYDVGLDIRIMPEMAAHLLRFAFQPRKINPVVPSFARESRDKGYPTS
jgi:hypothetical protein